MESCGELVYKSLPFILCLISYVFDQVHQHCFHSKALIPCCYSLRGLVLGFRGNTKMVLGPFPKKKKKSSEGESVYVSKHLLLLNNITVILVLQNKC